MGHPRPVHSSGVSTAAPGSGVTLSGRLGQGKGGALKSAWEKPLMQGGMRYPWAQNSGAGLQIHNSHIKHYIHTLCEDILVGTWVLVCEYTSQKTAHRTKSCSWKSGLHRCAKLTGTCENSEELNADLLTIGMQSRQFLAHTAHHIGTSLWKQLLRSLFNLPRPATLCEHLQHWQGLQETLLGVRSLYLWPSAGSPLPPSPEQGSSGDQQQPASGTHVATLLPARSLLHRPSGCGELKEQVTRRGLGQAQDGLSGPCPTGSSMGSGRHQEDVHSLDLTRVKETSLQFLFSAKNTWIEIYSPPN